MLTYSCSSVPDPGLGGIDLLKYSIRTIICADSVDQSPLTNMTNIFEGMIEVAQTTTALCEFVSVFVLTFWDSTKFPSWWHLAKRGYTVFLLACSFGGKVSGSVQ